MVDDIFRAIMSAGGRPLIVGGYVRDLVLSRITGQQFSPKDMDIEVYGLNVDVLSQVLAQFGQVDLVGASFGVLKVHGLDIDFSLPRRDSKVSAGHKGFVVTPDPWMSVKDAARRRDFTWNAMAYDPFIDQVIDPFDGALDLAQRRIQITDREHFSEDPLRVLRGMQFCGRFGITDFSLGTVVACEKLLREKPSLAKERVWGEWWKWATKSTVPSAGLRLLRECRWLDPELQDLVGCEQDPDWHPEGDAWEHTLLACDRATEIAIRDKLSDDGRAVLVLAALCHDLGKPAVTRHDGLHWISPGHDEAGREVARQFLISIGAPAWLVDQVVPLVGEHMAHVGAEPTPRSVRRLAQRLASASIEMLIRVIEADHAARPPMPDDVPDKAMRILWVAQANQVQDKPPVPILMGRHLIACGIEPGPGMGRILRAAFEAQLDNQFSTVEGGLDWLSLYFRQEA